MIGTYSIRLPLPMWGALALTGILLGIVISPTLVILSIVAVLVVGALFMVQSR